MSENRLVDNFKNTPRIILLIVGIIFASYGLVCMVFPQIVGMVTSLSAEGVAAKIETQAMYGGLQLGLGIWALLCAVRQEFQNMGLLSLVFLIGGLVLGRTYGVVFEPNAGAYIWGALFFEVLITLALLGALMANAGTRVQQSLHHQAGGSKVDTTDTHQL
ncbi:MAG TPA: hypothetical protein DCZ03_09540 [Gammaproteobacteria bacterium]|nr:hypothetical protein [Gammaproteobacteria bacterium]